VICGLISYIYKPATSSHFKPGLLKRCLWLGFFLTPKLLFMKITVHCGSWIKTSPDSRTSQIPDSQNFASFQQSWNRQQICEQESTSAVTIAHYQKVSMMYEIYQYFFMNVSFLRRRALHSQGDSRTSSRFRQIRRFKGVRFLSNSLTLCKYNG
jgi:hypothetical protein